MLYMCTVKPNSRPIMPLRSEIDPIDCELNKRRDAAIPTLLTCPVVPSMLILRMVRHTAVLKGLAAMNAPVPVSGWRRSDAF